LKHHRALAALRLAAYLFVADVFSDFDKSIGALVASLLELLPTWAS